MSVQETFGENLLCSICKLSEIDTLNYGEIHTKKELAVHLFCLYFSTHLPQRGQDNAGIPCFELRDIRNLIKNAANINCCYCHNGSASISCNFPNCDRVYHQVCGFKANARFEYLGHFRSYCHLHNAIEETEYPTKNHGFYICYEKLGKYHPVKTVPSCCYKWFHQQCLRNYAINAGYAFMCPICRNKSYGDFARRHGIYVPEYEALWEKTHDYTDIERFYTHCDATHCLCPNGRTFSNPKWNIQVCCCCGSYGLHQLCRNESDRENKITCGVCSQVKQSTKTVNHPQKPHLQQVASLSDQTRNELQQPKNNASRMDEEVIDLTTDGGDIDMFSETHEEQRNTLVRTFRMDDEDVLVDLTNFNDPINILDTNIRSDEEIETLAEKRMREKAERPLRNEMRDFRISLWFRDYENYGINNEAE